MDWDASHGCCTSKHLENCSVFYDVKEKSGQVIGRMAYADCEQEVTSEGILFREGMQPAVSKQKLRYDTTQTSSMGTRLSH